MHAGKLACAAKQRTTYSRTGSGSLSRFHPAADRRVLRTRNRIAAAIIWLGQERPVDSITVGQLSRRAGISRSTFYAHFASLEDYLANSFADMVERAVQCAATDPQHAQQILPIRLVLEHVASAPRFVASISLSRYRPRMLAEGEKRLTRLLELRLSEQRPGLSVRERSALGGFVAAAFIGMLRQWMESGMKRPPEQFRREFEALVARL